VAARVWLRSPLAKTFWRGVCLELCPESVLAHPELGDRETVLRWLRLPMAVGTLKAWLAQERHGCASAEGVCATRYELAHGLATLFAFLANAGEGRSRNQTVSWVIFRTLSLGQIEVDSADFWTDRVLSSSSRSTAEVLVSKHSNTRTLKSG
jgi:hypothetical protein